jgi:hypothetical protein
MNITIEYLNQRISQLESAYDSTIEKAGQIAGAIQEAKFMLQKLNEKDTTMACKGKGGKKK